MADVVRLTDHPDETAVFRRSLPFLRGHRAGLAAVAACNLGGAVLAVGSTAVIGRIVDAAAAGDRDALLFLAPALLPIVAGSGILAFLTRYLLVRVGERFLAGLRDRAMSAVAEAPLPFVEAHRRGDLLRRLTGEVDGLGRFAGGTLPDLVTAATVLLCTVVMLALYSWPLTLALLAGFLPAAVLIVHRFRRDAGPAFAAVAETEAAVAARFSESLPAQEQLRTSGSTARWLDRFDAVSRGWLAAEERRVRVEVRLNLLAVVQACCIGGLLVASAVLVGRGSLSVGVAVVFALATREVFARFEDLAASIGEAREAQVRLARVLDLIGACGAGRAGSGAVRGDVPAVGAPLPERGALTLTGVSYAYPDGAPVLDGMSLSVEPGDHLVVAGPTGSGKSTLGKLLCGLYRPDTGTVAFAGRDLAAVPPARIRERIAMVPQEVLLVDGTLGDNLTLVPTAPDRARVAQVLDRLGLASWAEALPDGLDTRVGAHGTELSAGERQLAAIVRAVLADPAVLVLDEATADVDHATAARIETALTAATAGDGSGAADGPTLIVIAHRAETLARGRARLTMPAGAVSRPERGTAR